MTRHHSGCWRRSALSRPNDSRMTRGEMDAQTRHAEFFHALGESAAPHLWDPQQQVWFDRLEREHDNLRAALQFWLGHGKPGSALRLATSLAPFWEARGHLRGGAGMA